MNAVLRATPLWTLMLMLAACGGGGDSSTGSETAAATSGSTSGSNVDSSAGGAVAAAEGVSEIAAATAAAPTLAQRKAAATKVAGKDASCTSLTPFYWEIGNATGKQASGTGGAVTSTNKAPTATTLMPVASASKWVFASTVIEQTAGSLSANDVALLSMRGGYNNFDSCSNTGTVASCLKEPGRFGGTNGDHIAAQDGKFSYGGGHMQVLGNARGLGPDNNSLLASALRSQRGMSNSMSYINPQLAGGLATTATGYASFLRQILDGSYASTAKSLGTQATCTHTNGSDCTTAIFSPINQSRPGGPNDISDERWHYSLGHWVEDDPTVGDGAFSSPGRFGFYPWIDKSKAWYGVLARTDSVNVNSTDPKKAPYNTSMQCGRKIRAAWVKGS
ncbi:hypothetical protein LRH25_15145 [Ideonella azotifigens]|uniref:Uncharacterized protein n=1 Tax=Ideonella azotifigens TaxID=513160 RepID=A0ABP3VAZ3_9BURK|nr:hypothetical protein [Ideonella azotifigens]MCD2341679.1 hypothetical protein [Ideonella azotifigens]